MNEIKTTDRIKKFVTDHQSHITVAVVTASLAAAITAWKQEEKRADQNERRLHRSMRGLGQTTDFLRHHGLYEEFIDSVS